MIFWTVIGTGAAVLGGFLAGLGWFMYRMQKAFDAFRDGFREDMAELREDMAEFRDEMRADMAEFRDGFRADMAEFRDGFREDIKEVNKRLTKIESCLVALEHPAVSA